MEQTIDKTTMLREMREARAEWETLLVEIPDAWRTSPGAVGDWSIKDLIAHLTWSEQEMVGMLRARALAGSDLWNLPLDERNEVIYRENRERPLGDIVEESRQVFDQLMAQMETLDEQDLHDPSRFKNMPADWVPWRVVWGNSPLHYRDHIPAVQKWLETAGHMM